MIFKLFVFMVLIQFKHFHCEKGDDRIKFY